MPLYMVTFLSCKEVTLFTCSTHLIMCSSQLPSLKCASIISPYQYYITKSLSLMLASVHLLTTPLYVATFLSFPLMDLQSPFTLTIPLYLTALFSLVLYDTTKHHCVVILYFTFSSCCHGAI